MLLQAIARVNRPYEDEDGLVSLAKALEVPVTALIEDVLEEK